MPIEGLDHVAITVSDPERTAAFYADVLGAEVLYLDLWRAGKIPVLCLQVGRNRINVHAAAAPASPHARTPLPGSQDLCFRFAGTIDEAREQLASRGVAIELGPEPRPASDGRWGESLYFRDPDGNLLELLTVSPGR